MIAVRLSCAIAAFALSCGCARDSRPLVVALGDSITYGQGLASPDTQNYAARYAARINGRIVNLAMPGYRCVDVVNDEIPKMPAGAAVVILNCGTNDIGGYGKNAAGVALGTLHGPVAGEALFAFGQKALRIALEVIRGRNPGATVYLVNLRHFQRMTGSETPEFSRQVDRWNAWLRTLGASVVDVSDDPRMYRPENFQADLLHPNAAGSEAMASDVHS